MKTLLIVSLLALSAIFARAADPVVVVSSATSVTINGIPAGTVVDALANNPNVPNLRARLLDAWIAREAEIVATEKARADAAIDAAAVKVAAANKETARVAAIVAALKSVNMGPLPPAVAAAIVDEDAKKKAQLEAQKAAIEADIAKLTQ